MKEYGESFYPLLEIDLNYQQNYRNQLSQRYKKQLLDIYINYLYLQNALLVENAEYSVDIQVSDIFREIQTGM